jgi:hypothetical protein
LTADHDKRTFSPNFTVSELADSVTRNGFVTTSARAEMPLVEPPGPVQSSLKSCAPVAFTNTHSPPTADLGPLQAPFAVHELAPSTFQLTHTRWPAYNGLEGEAHSETQPGWGLAAQRTIRMRLLALSEINTLPVRSTSTSQGASSSA